jgi:hypothetical protein
MKAPNKVKQLLTQKQSFSQAELVKLIIEVVGELKRNPSFGQNLSEEEIAFALAGIPENKATDPNGATK